jgi:hypothetical protein
MPLKKPGQDSLLTVPVVRILEPPQLTPEELPSLLREINERQWGAVLEVLIEAKMKAEAVLRNDTVFDSIGRSTFYQGWVAYADHIIGSLVSLRSQQASAQEQRQPGPEED